METRRVKIESVDFPSGEYGSGQVVVVFESGEERTVRADRINEDLLRDYQGTGLYLEIDVCPKICKIRETLSTEISALERLSIDSIRFGDRTEMTNWLHAAIHEVFMNEQTQSLECIRLPESIREFAGELLRDLMDVAPKLGLTPEEQEALSKMADKLLTGIEIDIEEAKLANNGRIN